MNANVFAMLILALLVLKGSDAIAAPTNGFSLNAGVVNDSMAATYVATGNAFSYSSSGLSLGMDYQAAISPDVSINPFLMSSSESSAGDLKSGTSVGHGIMGLQLRYWLNDFFVGGHVARYSEALLNSASNPSSTGGSGNGAGIVVGWEPSNSNWYLMGQYDSAKVNYSDVNVNLTGFRVSIGYRWK
jgi:hypothetical protein